MSIYIIGIILQELGSYIDRKITKIYRGMSRSILKGNVDVSCEGKTNNIVTSNPFVLQQYRTMANQILQDFSEEDIYPFYENDYINGYVFTLCQYYVSVCGKDKKTEKLRALFAMSKTLMASFFVLAMYAFLMMPFKNIHSFNLSKLIGISEYCCEICINKFLLSIIFAIITIVFYFRAKRIMKNFLLVLLGTYEAIKDKEKIREN